MSLMFQQEREQALSYLEKNDVPLSQRRAVLHSLSHDVGFMDQPTYQRYKQQSDATRKQMERVTRPFAHARSPEGVE